MRIKFFIKKFGLNNNIFNNIRCKDDIIIIILIKIDILDNSKDELWANTIKIALLMKKEIDDYKNAFNINKVKFKKNI